MSAIKLYRYPISGHAHRVEVFLGLLGLEHELIHVDIPSGEHKKPAFLAKNPFGQVPVIEDGDKVLADSAAILVYLAKKYDTSGQWLPEDADSYARIQRYIAIASGPVTNGPAAARRANLFGADINRVEVEKISKQVLTILNSELENTHWLVGNSPTLADVAIYSYVAHAPEGNIDLTPYENLTAWIERFESLRGFIPMQKSPVGLFA
ncbi:glutathione S-transferase [Litoribacillus peritrichatus]|uniref:Glutathione S-transferase n=1 Tax=Litoribacillus peritrichatus TaxID=718191 RepID=A0ABP7N3H9_9GAMM